MPASTTTPPRASARTWWTLPFLLLPALLTSMDISILFVASPAITEALNPTATQWLWMMDVYGFVMAGLLITMGSLGDRIGRKRLLLIGSLLFGAASAGIVFSATPEQLIVARALLGIGAATLAPSTLSLIRSMFHDPRQRQAAVGAWTVAFTGGAVAGPIVGGFLLEYFWWGSVFLINIPVMLVLLLTGPFLIPESRDPDATGFDIPGALTSLIAIVSLVFAVKQFVEYGMDPLAGSALALGLVFFAFFVRRQRRAAHPLIDLNLFRSARFSAAAGSNALVSLAAAGLGLLAFTFLQTVHGLSPLRAALWTLPTFVGTLAGATLATVLASRVRPAILLACGLLVAACGFGVVGVVEPGTSLAVFIGGYTVLTAGLGMVGTLANSLVLSTAPPERAGAAAGISETSNELGAALGIAAFGTVSTAVYRATMDGAAVEMTPAAGETVAGAVAEAAARDDAAATVLRDLAFGAYTEGINAAGLSGAVLLALMAVFVVVALRRVPAASGDTATEPESPTAAGPAADVEAPIPRR
ncbi:DHA2 family multidrug resistance protein-like MFS transporter [Actinoalloteichus hoggarensis]|uniref:Antiseptic resistance protein n=1 Tax=Actinoalloteichus hoggarensis TaxID=1470176 RepID=A0A221W751_9PSEU|nr:MFS transporter [Actinoalloteichus hoggarensis]ASO21772.1 Antiseptic resistance protein [Actinoalloteichus hoggarensis]MBB5922369.1 DHA2 family multidrug resistance protein-like MFS transporter [Actinoalloteichus hoggarensis]